MHTADLTEHIFTQIIKGDNFSPNTESIASMKYEANFNNTMKLHF